MALEQIGKYQIIELIDEGGMASVYKAIDNDSKEIVAIKTLKENINTHHETFIRFKKEAEILSGLNHPHILKFIDFIEQEQRVFIVTEYIQGKTLKQIIREGTLDLEEMTAVIIQIAETLDYVHSQDIIHRDIKPSNVMITGNLDVRILDFGVANLMNFQKLFSNKSDVAGSFAYMSPEQSGILRRDIDNRSDLYSLGILFYELVTRQLPYQAEEVGELLHQHIAKIPVEPISIQEALSPIINKIILKLMRKDPDDRYQTAFGLAEDLKIFLGLSVQQKKTFYLELGKKDRLKNLNYRTGLIGRKRELGHLLDHLNETVLEKGFVSAIIGKSGCGKSRLISELQKYTAAKNAFFISAVSNEGGQNHPYHPFISAAKKLLNTMQKLPEKKREDMFVRLKAKLGVEGVILSKVVPELSFLVGEYEEGTKFSRKESDVFFEKLKEFFLEMATTAHPLVFSFDDAHYWDQGSIQFFQYLLAGIGNRSIYLVLSFREELLGRVKELHDFLVIKAQQGEIGIVNLANINGEDVEYLVQEIFGTVYNGINEIAARLHETTQGNPLLLIENIKTLTEEGIILQKRDGWVVDLDKLSFFRFSSSILDKILTRLLKIRTSTRDVLSVAAILGKDFHFEILHAVLNIESKGISREQLLDNLSEAMKGDLIAERLSEKGEIHYSFNHDKVIETMISQMQERKIKQVHGMAAEVIEQSYEAEDKIYKLAYHYLMADQRQKAYKYNVSAGKQALAIFSLKLAISFFYNALEILNKFSQQTHKAIKAKIKLTLTIIELNLQVAELKKNIELLLQIKPLAEQINDLEASARILFFLGKNYYLSGDSLNAFKYYEEVIPIAEKEDLPELLAMPYCAIGRAACYTGDFRRAIDFITRGLAILSRLDLKEEALILERLYSLGVLGQCYGYCGLKKEALEVLSQLESLFSNDSNEIIKLYMEFYLASITALVGAPEKAVEECKKTSEMARDLKNSLIEIYSIYFLGLAYSRQQRMEEAIRCLSKFVALAKEKNISLGMFIALFFLAEFYSYLGNISMTKEILAEAEQYSESGNVSFVRQWKNRLLTYCQVFSPAPDLYQADELIDVAQKTSREMGQGYEYHHAHNALTKALVLFLKDQHEAGEKHFAEALAVYESLEMKTSVLHAKFLREKVSGRKGAAVHDTVTDFEITRTYTRTATQTEFSYQRQFSYLLKLSEQLAQEHEMQALLPRILSLAIEVSGAERGLLFLYEENAGGESAQIEVKAKKSIDAKEEQGEIRYSSLIIEKTMATGKGQLVIDAESELAGDKTVRDFNMKSIITAPLKTGGKVLGCVYLDNRQVKGLFTLENFELLKAFAIEAAISIENARLYEQVRQKARVEQEMAIAEDIQTSILPILKETGDYEIATFMRTASEVGGDYYDFYLDTEPYFGVFGDVSGHGLKSGLIMMMAEVAFNTLMKNEYLRKNENLEQLYQMINLTLYQNMQERLSLNSKLGKQYSSMYMTFRLFRFFNNGELEMFGNDHAEPFICRQDSGQIESISSSGFLIGIMQDAIIDGKSKHVKLESGDLLILYSDGITEAKKKAEGENSKRPDGSDKHLLFGERRLHELVAANRHLSPEDLIQVIINEVDEWMYSQADDITLAVMKKK